MTDQHRGAYTPVQDVPLEFDPRSPTQRRPLPIALLASAGVLVVVAGAVFLAYGRGARGENEAPRPVGEPIAVLKTSPAAAAQPQDVDGGLDVSAPQNVPTSAPVFAPPPEEPHARPSRLSIETAPSTVPPPPPPPAAARLASAAPAPAAPRTVATADAAAPAPAAPPAAAARAASLPAPRPIPAAAPAALASAAPVPAKAPPAVPHAAPARLAAAAPAAAASTVSAAATAVPARGAFQVQIGAFSSSALADAGYGDVSALFPGLMGGKSKRVEPVERSGRTLYRASVAGFHDRGAAVSFCDALKAKGKICFVKS